MQLVCELLIHSYSSGLPAILSLRQWMEPRLETGSCTLTFPVSPPRRVPSSQACPARRLDLQSLCLSSRGFLPSDGEGLPPPVSGVVVCVDGAVCPGGTRPPGVQGCVLWRRRILVTPPGEAMVSKLDGCGGGGSGLRGPACSWPRGEHRPRGVGCAGHRAWGAQATHRAWGAQATGREVRRLSECSEGSQGGPSCGSAYCLGGEHALSVMEMLVNRPMCTRSFSLNVFSFQSPEAGWL